MINIQTSTHQLRQALEEGKVCSLNEDDLREANDVLMEELRKARKPHGKRGWKVGNGLEPRVFAFFLHDFGCFLLIVG